MICYAVFTQNFLVCLESRITISIFRICLCVYLVGVSDHRLVNFMICVSNLDGCARRTQGFILIQAERPYVQSDACYQHLLCSRGYKQTRERKSQVSDGRIEC